MGILPEDSPHQNMSVEEEVRISQCGGGGGAGAKKIIVKFFWAPFHTSKNCGVPFLAMKIMGQPYRKASKLNIYCNFFKVPLTKVKF